MSPKNLILSKFLLNEKEITYIVAWFSFILNDCYCLKYELLCRDSLYIEIIVLYLYISILSCIISLVL